MPPATREGMRFILPLIGVWVVLIVLQMVWALILAGVVLVAIFFCFYFFRDPRREPPGDASLVVAAADGKVVGTEEMDEPFFGLGRMKRVAIFLSVFDVHVNRMPVTGRLAKSIYKKGEFLDVRHPKAPDRNEYQAWLIETEDGTPVVVRAIAGLVARRIVPWAQEGDTLRRGARFGMIRFGSRTEIFLPLDCDLLVSPGDRVAGAETPIARWPRKRSTSTAQTAEPEVALV